jgi:hypothetical protein
MLGIPPKPVGAILMGRGEATRWSFGETAARSEECCRFDDANYVETQICSGGLRPPGEKPILRSS